MCRIQKLMRACSQVPCCSMLGPACRTASKALGALARVMRLSTAAGAATVDPAAALGTARRQAAALVPQVGLLRSLQEAGPHSVCPASAP